MKKKKECAFDINGECHALVCYSSQKCNSRDKNGNPQYASISDMSLRDLNIKKNKIKINKKKKDINKGNKVGRVAE